MSRKRKDSKAINCMIERNIFEKLEEYCSLTKMGKTQTIEVALEKYLKEQLKKIRKSQKEEES